MLDTQVAFVGAGPAGLLLGARLGREGIAHVIVEKHSASHVLARVRPGIFEPAAVALLHDAGAVERLAREGLAHEGLFLSVAGTRHPSAFRHSAAATSVRALLAENYVGLVRKA